MAREITGVGKLQPNGRTATTMLYVFPITPRIVDADGVEVIPAFDPAGIPNRFASKLTQAQLTAMAAGDVGYVATTLEKAAGESDAAFAARVRVDYDVVTAYELQQARDRAVEANAFDQRRFQLNR